MNEHSDNTSKPPTASVSERRAATIVSWNVNSVKMRLPQILSYLQKKAPDAVLLQEIKTENDGFPVFEIESAGYHCLVNGQKSYNGVALISKEKFIPVQTSLPDFDAVGQARYIEADCPVLNLKLASVYVPNGEPSSSDPDGREKLDYKLAFMDALIKHAGNLLRQNVPFVIGGDFNVIETDSDVYNPTAFKNSAFTIPAVRERFRSFYLQGLTNALRLKSNRFPLYSYWDYRFGAWQKNNGILLDHLFLSPALADGLTDADVESDVRGEDKASDHAPIKCTFSL